MISGMAGHVHQHQVNDKFGGRTYSFNTYEDLIPVFRNKGIDLTHNDVMDVS